MAVDYNRIITQTGKTIILDCFNSEKTSLARILRTRWSSSANDAIIQEIDSKEEGLLVHSFQEFLERFQPTVYRQTGADENGEPDVAYVSYKPQEEGWEPVVLANEALYRAVQKVAADKTNSGKASLEFGYQSILNEQLGPVQERKNAEKVRKDVESLTQTIMDEKALGHNSRAHDLNNRLKIMIQSIINYGESGQPGLA